MTLKEKWRIIFMNKNEISNNNKEKKEKEKEKEKEDKGIKKTQTPLKDNILFTILLILILSVTGLSYLSYLTGNGLNIGELFDKMRQEVFLFIAIAMSIVLLGIKMDIISWGTLRVLSIISIVLMFIHLIGASIWPNWNPRNWAQEITKPKVEISTQRKKDSYNPRILHLTNPCVLKFQVTPWQKLKEYFKVAEGLTWHISTAKKGDDFYLLYKNGHNVHINTNKEGKEKKGTFSFMNGKNPTIMTLVVVEN